MKRLAAFALGLGLAAGCDFDAAYRTFCEDNPECAAADAGTGTADASTSSGCYSDRACGTNDCVMPRHHPGDAGTPAGTCAPFQACDHGNIFPGDNGGPDVCYYAQVCSLDDVCTPVDNGDCGLGDSPGWEWTGVDGPVIVRAEGRLGPSPTCFGSGMTVEIYFYAPYSGLSGHQVEVIFESAGSSQTVSVDPPPFGEGNAGKLIASLCDASITSVTNWSVALRDGYHVGNQMCVAQAP